jgi:hypothetical protein
LPRHIQQSGDFPVKVIAEIKITDRTKSYIFNAFGSGLTDDRRTSLYGGVVCLYNKKEVRVYAPKSRRDLKKTYGYVVYLGMNKRM